MAAKLSGARRHRRQLGRDGLVALARRHHGVAEHLADDLVGEGAREGGLSGQHLVEHGAQLVHVTALGEGARRYVTGEFSSLGTNLVIVIPGRSETTGASPALFAGETPRDLTVADAAALTRSALVSMVTPLQPGGRNR